MTILASKYLPQEPPFAYVAKLPAGIDSKAIDDIVSDFFDIFLYPIRYKMWDYTSKTPKPAGAKPQLSARSSNSALTCTRPPLGPEVSNVSLFIGRSSPDQATTRSRKRTTDYEQMREGHQFRSVHKRNDVDVDDDDSYLNSVAEIWNPGTSMSTLSVPPGLKPDGSEGNLQWQYGGAGTSVYVIDSGLDTRYSEFDGASIRWLYPALESLEEPGDGYSSSDSQLVWGHGSQVAAKVIGTHIGTAPMANLIVVPDELSVGKYRNLGSTLQNMWLKVHDDIVETKDKWKAGYCVVVFSAGHSFYDRGGSIDYHLAKRIVTAIGKLGCYVVAAGGNEISDPENPTQDRKKLRIPQILSGNRDLDKVLLIVGGHDLDGYNYFEYNKYTRISAPAVDLVGLKPIDHPESPPPIDDERWSSRSYDYIDGTSFSGPTVAGILATFISQGYRDPLGYLLAISKDPMRPGEPRIAWNGIYPDMYPQSYIDSSPMAQTLKEYKRPPLKDPRVADKGPPIRLVP
ncbi:hypothetical protein TWF481_009034 [Arthrobotrys musiformis]|uniref:Peptidase S8/S53 domain-containing protein n=1 Tax=Arthrobotrys musiformis TaxID=47236 RepID=A0AAV9W3U8_9PEZI